MVPEPPSRFHNCAPMRRGSAIRKRLIMAALDAVMAFVCAAYLLLSGTADVIGLAVAALVALYAVHPQTPGATFR